MVAGFAILYLCLTKLSGNMWNYGLWWYPFFLIAPGFAMDLGYTAHLLGSFKIGNLFKNAMEEIGKSSFEIFLWHIGIFEFVKPRYQMSGVTWAVLGLAAVLWGIGYRKGIERVKKVITFKRK